MAKVDKVASYLGGGLCQTESGSVVPGTGATEYSVNGNPFDRSVSQWVPLLGGMGSQSNIAQNKKRIVIPKPPLKMKYMIRSFRNVPEYSEVMDHTKFFGLFESEPGMGGQYYRISYNDRVFRDNVIEWVEQESPGPILNAIIALNRFIVACYVNIDGVIKTVVSEFDGEHWSVSELYENNEYESFVFLKFDTRIYAFAFTNDPPGTMQVWTTGSTGGWSKEDSVVLPEVYKPEIPDSVGWSINFITPFTDGEHIYLCYTPTWRIFGSIGTIFGVPQWCQYPSMSSTDVITWLSGDIQILSATYTGDTCFPTFIGYPIGWQKTMRYRNGIWSDVSENIATGSGIYNNRFILVEDAKIGVYPTQDNTAVYAEQNPPQYIGYPQWVFGWGVKSPSDQNSIFIAGHEIQEYGADPINKLFTVVYDYA